MALAQEEVEVFSTVDRNEMAVGDTFTLSVSASSSSSLTLEPPELSGFPDFDLINSWTGSESRSTFTNGSFQVRQTRTFNFMLSPKKEGTLNLPALALNANGKTYYTKPIRIQVSAESEPTQRQARPRGGVPPGGVPPDPQELYEDADDLFAQLLQRRLGQRGGGGSGGTRTEPVNPSEAFFIQVEVDKTKAFVGEQVTASWYLYTRSQIRDIDTIKYPSLVGFWKEDIHLATRLEFQQEVINGIAWQKALLASFALFPIKAGQSIVDPYKAKCTVMPLGGFGFGRTYVYTKSSKPIKIQVVDLPAEGRPANFSGAVGRFRVTAGLDQSTVPANQPVTLKVRFEGQGNAKLIELPPLNLPPSVEVYDTKSDSKFSPDGSSYKEFEVLLIPREAGQIVIPPLSVSVFDPKSQTYQPQTTTEFKLTVTPGSGNQNVPSSTLAGGQAGQNTVQAPQLPGLALDWKSSLRWSPAEKMGLWVFVYVLIFAFLGWRAVIELGWGRRKKNLNDLLRLRLKKVRAKIDEGQWRQVGVEATNLVYAILGELSGQGGASLELSKLLAQAPPSLRRAVGDELEKILKAFEALSFAPEGLLGDLKEKKKQKELLAQLESILSKAIKTADPESSSTSESPVV